MIRFTSSRLIQRQKLNNTISQKEIDVNYMVNGTQNPNNQKDIINQIINVLSKHNLNITDANEILRIVSKKIGNQKVMKN